MYEDLVKDLRDPQVGDGTQYTKIYIRREAADAIENLQKIIDRQKDMINSYEELLKAARAMHLWIFLHSGNEELAYKACGLSDEMNAFLGYSGSLTLTVPGEDVQPVKWIPVTERLPEEYEDVLCYYEYFRYGDFNCMFRTIDRGYYGDGIWGGEAGQGHKNKVLAWMPLPEPPKDGET